MRTSAKLGLTALVAAFLLASAVSTASARNLSVSEQSFRVSWASLEFNALAVVRCRVTLEGSVHSRTIPKVARLLIGAVSRVIVSRPCTNGEAWADNGTEVEPLGTSPNRLPFHLTYESFEGRLPVITSLGLLLSRVSFVIRASALGLTAQCRFGNATDNISGTAALEGGGGITSIRPVERRNIGSLVDDLGPNRVCPATGRFGGTSGAVRGLTNTNTVTVRLI